MFGRNRFWWWFAASTVVTSLHPLGVYIARPGAASQAWIKNDPAMTAFAVCMLPWIIAIGATILLPDLCENFTAHARQTCGRIFAGLTLVALFLIVLPDLRRSPVEPYVLKTVDAAATVEETQREIVRQKYTEYEREPPTTKDDIAAMEVALRTTSRTAVDAYKVEATAGFSGLADFARRARFSGWTKLFINAVSGVVVSFYFAVILTVGYTLLMGQRHPFNVEALLIAVSLFVLWFPMRLYTEWYLHFFTLSYLENFAAFFVLMFVALLSLLWVVFIVKPSRAAVTIPTLASAFTAAFGLVTLFKPTMLWTLARAFEKMDFEYVLAILAVGIACTSMIVSAVMRNRARIAIDLVNPS